MGMGKSTAAQLLRQGGIAVVDSDQLARQIVEPGQPALAEITAVFGADILDPQGRLCRQEMARRVFASPPQRQRLEAILHPRIRASWKSQFDAWTAEGRGAAAVDIPLLFETHAESEFDFIVCVSCSQTTQRARLHQRGWSDIDIDRRLTAQWPPAQKATMADYVVWTESGLEIHRAQLARILHAEALAFHA